MNSCSQFGTLRDVRFEVLWEVDDRAFCRMSYTQPDGSPVAALAVRPGVAYPKHDSLHRLAHEYSLKDELDRAWAARPLELLREADWTLLLLEDTGGRPLKELVGKPMEVGRALELAVGIVGALGKAHQRGLIHKDLKPANILANCADGQVRLTGFGIASRLPRERQAAEPPETIAGTLAYMAPEQTGHMNRSIDARSDLYALGVILYELLTGALPFAAAGAMEWVHCHIATMPVPPSARLTSVPGKLSEIVMKLLAKTAEERYQTAAGVGRDLRRCLAQWTAQRWIGEFPLGEEDIPDRLLIPERLYGRAHEVATLLACFNRVVERGTPEVVLISGYSGVGKSAVVHELRKALVPLRGLFASGKFDQYKRDIPYSTLIQAFQSLVKSLLVKRDAELEGWRGALTEALGPNGGLMTVLIPDLKIIIGDQPPVRELEPQQSQIRFQLVFRRFIGVFCRTEHPLTLFLDDLQWLDAATLSLLEDLLTHPDLPYLMFVGAFRDNEVDAGHPLMHKLEGIKKAGVKIEELTIAPLAREHIEQLIADAFYCEPQRVAPLAQLVHAKTAGNPFFVIQFLHALAEERLISFDHDTASWRWDIERIHTTGYANNVVELMIERLSRLPRETQCALQQMACLGNIAKTTMLAIVRGCSRAAVHEALWAAVRLELVEQTADSYRFVHDRVEEAAYSLIPITLRAETHLYIGRLLAASTPPENQEDVIFDIVHQLNRGAVLITSREERDQLVAFNLIAGKRAKVSTAYASALTYFVSGAELLTDDSWARKHELTFALELNRAECEYLTGQLPAAESRLATLSERAATPVDRARVTCLRMDVCTTLDQSDCAVSVCLDYLRRVGIEWSPHPQDDEVRNEYERIEALLGRRTIEDLIDMPLMEDPASLATVETLSKLLPPALLTDSNLASLTICKAVSLSLERGNCDASCFAYVMLGRIAGPRFGDYESGFRFGQLGYELVNRRGLKRFEASTTLFFSIFVVRWMRHVRTCRDLMRRAFDAANRISDLMYAAYTCNNLNSDLLFAGDPLPEVQAEAERGFAFARNARLGLVVDIIATQLQLMRTLRGLTPTFGVFDEPGFDEARFERHLETDPRLAIAVCWHQIRKLQARYLAGNYVEAIGVASKAKPLLWTSRSFIEEAEYHFYGALAEAASCNDERPEERQQHLNAVLEHLARLQVWAKHCPQNFEDRAALVGAELARIEERDGDAMRLYEQALRAARASRFPHNEAIAYECAAAFYRARGLNQFADLYLRNARNCYLSWGAEGKVRQLDAMHPFLSTHDAAITPTTMIGAPVDQMDLVTVLKVSQAVSGEIVLDRLLETLVRTALEQAGAERALLILTSEGEPCVKATAESKGDTLLVQVRDEPVKTPTMPESVLHYVMRTRETITLDDAVIQDPFGADPYIRERQVRSVLCLPLINQGEYIGALYLENNLTRRVFAPSRIAVLKLLASQAAMALENARLYRDLVEREAKIRRLVDANIVGILIYSLDGQILEANDAFLRIIGYAREDLTSGRLRWTELTPAEWLDCDRQLRVPELMATGSLQPYEKEFFRRDGTRVPVLLGVASFEESSRQGVAFVLDLSERKRAEAEARESERRCQEAQLALAHANRVTTMGELAATISHEIKQPIAATTTLAHAGMLWLRATPPNLEEVQQSFDLIITNATRASEIMDRIRGLVKNAPPCGERLQINDAIREVTALARPEFEKHRVSMRTQLAGNLPQVKGDRIQLQQVILNLVLNAIEAMNTLDDATREIVISTAEDESRRALVTVRDSGPGVPAASRERLFQAFYTTKASGMGMGLSICRSIVEGHGGRLWVGSNELQGAVFQFTVPIDQGNA